MAKDLFIRGLDEEIHKKLAKTAEKKGVSLNSVLKDAVDKWASQDEDEKPRHDLILYSDDQALINFLKSLDYSSKNDNVLRVCCGSENNTGVKFLKKQGWLDGSVKPYKEFFEKPYQYAEKTMKKISKNHDNKSFFGLEFLAGELAEKKSLKTAVKFCDWYNKKQVPGSTFCVANYKNLLSGSLDELLAFFETHGQVFIIRKTGLFKIHVSEESIHKLFLD